MAQRTITESIYFEVRFAVLSGHYLPGQILDRDELCQAYGCKSASVADALNVLVMEGYLDVPRRGVFGVRHWCPEEINDLFDIRSSMMGMAAARAAERATDHEIAQLIRLATASGPFHLADPSGTEALICASAKIQSLIVKVARVVTISEMARSMCPNALHRKCIWVQSAAQLKRNWALLVKVCQQIERRAPEDAVAAMTDYVEAMRGPLIAANPKLEKMAWTEFPEIRRAVCSIVSQGCAFGAGEREPTLDGRIIAFGVARAR